MTKVIIKDELMGTGKSTRMIEEINNSHPDQRYIVVVPFLAEAHRYAGTLSDPDSGDEDAPLAYRRPLETRGGLCTRVRAVTLLAEHSTTLKAGTEARLSTLNVLLRGDVARFPAAIASA